MKTRDIAEQDHVSAGQDHLQSHSQRRHIRRGGLEGAVVFLEAWFGGVIEVVHVLLVELGLLVTLSKQVRQ